MKNNRHNHLRQHCSKLLHIISRTSKAKACSKKCKGVQFFPSVRTVSWRPGTEKKEDLWYTKEAYQSFKDEVSRTAQSVLQFQNNGTDLSLLDPCEYCLVGLDDRISRDQIRERKRRTRKHTSDILHSQQRLRCLGIQDPNLISTIAEKASRQSRHLAFQRAADVRLLG